MRAPRWRKGCSSIASFGATVPDVASTIAVCGQVPPDPAFPAELHLRPFILFGGLYAGDAQEGQQVLQPLRDFGAPLIDFSGVRPYTEAQRAWDADYPAGKRYYWKSTNVLSLDDDAITCIAEHAQRQPSPHSTIDVWHIGGAVKRVSPDASAFNGRQGAFIISPEGNWEHHEEDHTNIDWVRAIVADMQPYSDGSSYLNFPGFYEEGDEMMKMSFGPQYERLARLKAKYDPANLFGLNQNVKPLAPATKHSQVGWYKPNFWHRCWATRGWCWPMASTTSWRANRSRQRYSTIPRCDALLGHCLGVGTQHQPAEMMWRIWTRLRLATIVTTMNRRLTANG